MNKQVKRTAPKQYATVQDEPECVSESILSSILTSSQIQNQRLLELNGYVAELMSHLGLGIKGDDSQKLSAAPYGKLEEIRQSQDCVFQNINDLESAIFDLRRALM